MNQQAIDANDYEILHCIRSTSKASSYLARDKSGNKVTLTFIDNEKILEKYRFIAHENGGSVEDTTSGAQGHLHEFQKNIRETVERIRNLGNHHVATTYGCYTDKDKDQLVVVSEHTPGIDLFYASGRLKPIQQIFLFAQILDGIDYIHSCGFLHLNVKPSRIFVDYDLETPVARLTDFGFAIPVSGYSGEYSGTILYMPPEVVEDRRDKIDERADLYSFGVTMYYCLTGHNPLEHRFEAHARKQKLAAIIAREANVFAPPSNFNKEIPPELDNIVLNLLEKDPDRRTWKNAGALLKVFYEKWPNESNQMIGQGTSTLLAYD